MADRFENPMGTDGFEFLEYTAPQEGRKMSDIREIHGAPLNGPRDEQSGLPREASRVKAELAVAGRWIVDEMDVWHGRRLAVRELTRHLGRSAR